MWTVFRRLPATLSLCVGLSLFAGCDSGPLQPSGDAEFQAADTKYTASVTEKVPLNDPAWDQVVAAFEKVPPGSKARPEADRRIAAIRTLRGALPPRPLATPGATGPGTSEADTQRAACEALAKKLGQTHDEPTRAPLRKALDDCRAQLVRLESHNHPPGEAGDEHGGELH
ncbi:hypothetical protein LZ198_17235 [Myxococcus sp. K15C18031901]|uniref:hypothetical protein n=1 Tax=Myxococcus dinghuensis TaxID=2906761 RepID=UPI0020A771D4|nr:hypothetical protein [Myxococcus dinghuensis]MCP3100617.1 hypothetical protein [Myxococcus dinghuensis]